MALTFTVLFSGTAAAQRPSSATQNPGRDGEQNGNGSGGASSDQVAPPTNVPTDAPPVVPEPAAPATTAPGGDESSADTQVASFAVTRLKDSPAVVTVISGEDIRSSGARDLVDILNLVPGYFLGQDVQGMVGAGFRGLWGQEGKILLMIDGKEMNELLFSTLQLGNEFPVELIERVEVVRGPGSVIYGGSAELSVINVVTRGVQGATDATAHFVLGQMTDAKQFSTGQARRRVTMSGRYVFDSVPGLSSFAAVSLGSGQRSVRSFLDNAGMSSTMEGQSKLSPTAIQMGVGYRDLQATFLYQSLDSNSIAPLGLALTAPIATSFQSYHGELVGTFRPSDKFEIVPRFNITYQRPWRAPDQNASFYFDTGVRRVRGRLLGRWAALDQLQVTVGGDTMFDEATLLAPPGKGQQKPFGGDIADPLSGSNSVSYQTFAGFIELFSENPIVNIAAGLRYDHLSSVGGALVPRLVLLRSFGAVSVKGLFSLSFRAPGIENIDLAYTGSKVRPERTTVFEFETAIDLPMQQRLSANVYDLKIEAPISYTVDPMTGDQGYLNLGKQGTRGFEIAYNWRGTLGKVEANYSFYAPSISENIGSYAVTGHSDQFMAASAHRGSVRGTFWVWNRIGISPTVVILGPRYTLGIPDASTMPPTDTVESVPAQALVNLYLYRENLGMRGLTVGLGLYNMFGAQYRYLSASTRALPGLDREVLLNLSYKFEPSGG